MLGDLQDDGLEESEADEDRESMHRPNHLLLDRSRRSSTPAWKIAQLAQEKVKRADARE